MDHLESRPSSVETGVDNVDYFIEFHSPSTVLDIDSLVLLIQPCVSVVTLVRYV